MIFQQLACPSVTHTRNDAARIPLCAKPPAQALVALLASLSDSIISEATCQALFEAKHVGDVVARASSFVLDLPPLHRDVFVYLVG